MNMESHGGVEEENTWQPEGKGNTTGSVEPLLVPDMLDGTAIQVRRKQGMNGCRADEAMRASTVSEV